MLLRDALNLVRTVRLKAGANFALVCSCEPLHLATYLQAYLAVRFPEEIPQVVTFGYDQLERGLCATESDLASAPVLLVLGWEDLHPALSWRSRGEFGDLPQGEVTARAEALGARLDGWLAGRAAAETYVVLPQTSWLPLHDPLPSSALGMVATEACSALWTLAWRLARAGARVLHLAPQELNYRDLIRAGCPFSLDGGEALARQCVETAFPRVERKKAIVTDLDETLWKGTIGEDGPDRVRSLTEESGAAHLVLQKFLGKLKREGILLGFCSKNSAEFLVPVFDSLGLPLRLSDFSAYRCNWELKSENIRAIARELNIGTDALIVLDNNEAELAEIRAHLPEVCTLRTPHEGKEWPALFHALQNLCGTWRVSEEDRRRSEMMAGNRARQVRGPSNGRRMEDGTGARAHDPHSLEHLKDFQLEVSINERAFADPRSLELINKTNQFNLTGERFSQEDWLRWGETEGTFCLSARLRDRFGDFGTIAVVTGAMRGDSAVSLRQFVLSCRAFGRGVEAVLAAQLARHGTWDWLSGPFLRTSKNEPAARFLAWLGCTPSPDGQWRVHRETVRQLGERVLHETGAKVVVS